MKKGKAGFTYELDENNNLVADRKFLNQKLGLLPTLKYNVGKYTDEIEPEDKEGRAGGLAVVVAKDVNIKYKDGRVERWGGMVRGYFSWDTKGNIFKKTISDGKQSPGAKIFYVDSIPTINYPEANDWRDVKINVLTERFLDTPEAMALINRVVKESIDGWNKTDKELGRKESTYDFSNIK